MAPGKGRGFASMDKTKQKQIASKGGKAAHKKELRTNGLVRKQELQDNSVDELVRKEDKNILFK